MPWHTLVCVLGNGDLWIYRCCFCQNNVDECLRVCPCVDLVLQSFLAESETGNPDKCSRYVVSFSAGFAIPHAAREEEISRRMKRENKSSNDVELTAVKFCSCTLEKLCGNVMQATETTDFVS